MAGVPARPQTFFRVSPAQAQCFAVRRGEILGRSDAMFHRPWIRDRLTLLKKSNFTVARLGTVAAQILHGISSPPPYLDKSEKTVPFVRATDIKDGEVNFDTLLHISGDQPNHFAKCRLSGGELIIVRSGVNTGDCAVVPELLADSFAAYDLILKFQSDISAKFVATFLDTKIGRLQLNLVKGRSAQPHINTGEVAAIQIPLPPIEFQHELVSAMDAARAERKAKLAEADALLAGMDDYVLDALGINPNPPQRTTFAVRINHAGAFRADPDFHSLRFSTIRGEIENGRYPAKRIDEVCNLITSGFAAGPQNQAFDYENGVPHLRPLNLDIFGQLSLENTKFVPSESVSEANWCVSGEVLFNNTNSTDLVGKSAVFDIEQPCACSNHVTRLRLHAGIKPEYIASVLNALRRLGYLGLLSTNFNNQAGINTVTLSQLQIPLPTSEIQQSIAAEIDRRRQEARRLRAEAEAGWQTARRWFEGELLGVADTTTEGPSY